MPGIVGFGRRAGWRGQALAAREAERLRALRDRLLAGLRDPHRRQSTSTAALEPRLPGNLHVSIARVEAETLILSLGGRIALSSGAACAEADGKGSHVLRALGLAGRARLHALRFGLGRYNTEAEVDDVVEALAAARGPGQVAQRRDRGAPAVLRGFRSRVESPSRKSRASVTLLSQSAERSKPRFETVS